VIKVAKILFALVATACVLAIPAASALAHEYRVVEGKFQSKTNSFTVGEAAVSCKTRWTIKVKGQFKTLPVRVSYTECKFSDGSIIKEGAATVKASEGTGKTDCQFELKEPKETATNRYKIEVRIPSACQIVIEVKLRILGTCVIDVRGPLQVIITAQSMAKETQLEANAQPILVKKATNCPGISETENKEKAKYSEKVRAPEDTIK